MMLTRARTPSALLALSTALTLAACSQSAESAQDQSSVRLEASPQEAQVQPASEVAPQSGVATEPAEAPVPVIAERPAPRPAAPRPEPAAAPQPASVPATPQPTPARAFIAEGTQIAATVEEELSTETTREGDRFHAVLADDVLGANGEVLLSKGAVLNGRVAESRESAGANDPAVLRLDIESVTAGGRTLQLQADVVELDAEIATRDSGQKTAVKVGAGAVAGAAIGRILGGDRSSAIKGAVVGAAAGTAVAMTTKDGQAVVKPGARMVVQLTERLVVEP